MAAPLALALLLGDAEISMIKTASTWLLVLLVASPSAAPLSTSHPHDLFGRLASAHALAAGVPAVSIAAVSPTDHDTYAASPIEPQTEPSHDSPLRAATRASSVYDAGIDGLACRWQQLNQSDHQASARPAVLRL